MNSIIIRVFFTRLIPLICMFLLSCGGSFRVARLDPERLPEEILKEYVSPSGKGFPGIAVAVIRGGEIVYMEAAGVRNRDSSQEVTVSDAFHIGSNTKAMTALLCGILVDRGLFSWDITVSQILGTDIPMHEEFKKVTLEQLLSHTSGINDGSVITPDTMMSFFPYDSPAGKDRERLVRYILEAPPSHTPGSKFQYSNFGYILAGFMAEKVSSITWENLIRKEIFSPLQISDAGFGPPARNVSKESSLSAVWGHSPQPIDPSFKYADLPEVFGPAGLVHVNLSDLIKYLTIYWNGGKSAMGQRIISDSVLGDLLKPRLEGYSLGWFIDETDEGIQFITHDGSNYTFYSSISVIPNQSNAVIVLTNCGDRDGLIGKQVDALARYLAERFLDIRVSKK